VAERLYRGRDPRAIPAYPVSEAALYLRVPARTLREWTAPREVRGGLEPAIIRAEDRRVLSFWDLAEAYVLANLRRQHRVSLQRISAAVGYVRDSFGLPRPLIDARFVTDGVDMFLDRVLGSTLLNASRRGQLAFRDFFRCSLERVDHDTSGLAERLYPFAQRPTERKYAVIDPRRAFGRMVIIGTRIPVSSVVDRFEATESIDSIAADYGLERELVEGAIRWGMRAEAAAA